MNPSGDANPNPYKIPGAPGRFFSENRPPPRGFLRPTRNMRFFPFYFLYIHARCIKSVATNANNPATFFATG